MPWHPFGVQTSHVLATGGLRCASTSGYCLATLRVASLSRPSSRARIRRMQLVIRGRLRAQEVADEIIPPAARHVVGGGAVSVPLIREHQQVEVSVRLDERVDDQQRVVW